MSAAPAAAPPPPPPAAAPAQPAAVWMEVLYDYDSDDVSIMSLKAGQKIEVLERHDTGWWLGKIDGVESFFPSNYCSLLP